jgi:hypothetical protein
VAEQIAGGLQERWPVSSTKKIPLAVIEGVSPVSEKPYLDMTAYTRLKGHYPSRPYEVEFELDYNLPRLAVEAVSVSMSRPGTRIGMPGEDGRNVFCTGEVGCQTEESGCEEYWSCRC